MRKTELADLRRDFNASGLDEAEAARDPFEQFSAWMDDALAADIIDPNAMTVSTVGDDNRPSARVVLLKYFDAAGLVFFTNYESKKGTDLTHNPATVFHFFWPQLARQIAVYGTVARTTREESRQYFDSRPVDSRLAAWTSNQSREIASRDVLEKGFEDFKAKFGDEVPLPDFWGGFRLTPDRFEFWQGRQNRLHDRIIYQSDGDAWRIKRLSP